MNEIASVALLPRNDGILDGILNEIASAFLKPRNDENSSDQITQKNTPSVLSKPLGIYSNKIIVKGHMVWLFKTDGLIIWESLFLIKEKLFDLVYTFGIIKLQNS